MSYIQNERAAQGAVCASAARTAAKLTMSRGSSNGKYYVKYASTRCKLAQFLNKVFA